MEGTSADGHLLRAEILYNFDFWENFVPFVAARRRRNFSLFQTTMIDLQQFFSYGAGAKYYFNDNWALRGDIRHILADNQHPTNQMLVTLGLSYFFWRAGHTSSSHNVCSLSCDCSTKRRILSSSSERRGNYLHSSRKKYISTVSSTGSAIHSPACDCMCGNRRKI